MRVRVPYRVASKENFVRFKQAHPNLEVEYLEWCNIIYTFMYNFRDHVLESGEKAKLPHGLGFFAISKKKPKRVIVDKEGKEHLNLPIDWKKTKKIGKHIYHMNYHTEGFRFKWKWWTYSARFFKADIWNFKPSRISSRMLAHYVGQGSQYHHKYKEWHLLKGQ